MIINETKILVIGCWHLGSVIGSCLAMRENNKVFLWDQNPNVEKSWREGRPPIFEPGLEEIATTHFNENLFWCEDGISRVKREADWIIFAYDTPTNDQDDVELDSIWEGVEKLIDGELSAVSNIIFTCQLPVGTTRKIKEKIEDTHPEWKGDIIYTPENLRMGEAISTFEKPDRVVLGFNKRVDKSGDKSGDKIEKQYRDLVQNHETPIELMSIESAEMVKHVLNSFLGTCIVFANEISDLCEISGADAWDVLSSIKKDSRVGPKAFLRPGLGFSGGTIARDVKILSQLFDSSLFSFLYQKNIKRNEWIINKLRSKLGLLSGKKVVLLGVTYKPGTSTIRKSPAVDIARTLSNEGVICVALDPHVDLSELSDSEKERLYFKLEKDYSKAFQSVDAAILVTEWPNFKELDWEYVASIMNRALILDTKNYLSNLNPKLFELIIPGKRHSPENEKPVNGHSRESVIPVKTGIQDK